MALVVLIVLGIGGVAGGGVSLSRELTRKATRAETAAAAAKEVATRWERLPAGKIFPASITYQNAAGDNVSASLVGIARPASCRAALTSAAYRAIRSYGCSTMLRATYIIGSGVVAATVGVGVMPSVAAAGNATTALRSQAPGAVLSTAPFPGTVTNTFVNSARAAGGSVGSPGPYLFLYSVGYTDGVPPRPASTNPELASLGVGILNKVEATLTASGNPCAMKDIKC